MIITPYKAVEKKHPFNASSSNTFYVKDVPNSDTNLESLTKRIITLYTVIRTDCIIALNSLEENFIRKLKYGSIAKLTKLDRFKTNINCKG